MCKGTSKTLNDQEKMLFSLPEIVSDKKIRVDFASPDISSGLFSLSISRVRCRFWYTIRRI